MMRHVALLCLSLGSCQFATACTSVAIGRKATADGSVFVAQSEDGDDLADPRVMYIPARDHPPGSMAPSYYTDGPFPRWVSEDLGPGYKPNKVTGPNVTTPIGYIPQVPHTFAYWDSNYGIINEHNVGIGETTCSAMFKTCAKGDTRGCEPGRKMGEALLDVRMLTMFGLERATTARQAIEVMGSLAYEYGFYGTHDPNGDGESLMVGDAQEAWVFHILADPTGTKAIWVAKRVPDDSITVASNMFTIRDVNTSDTDNCMASPNIYSVAEEHGWWKPGEVLDFTKVYSNGEYGSKYYSGRRMWRGMSLAAPSLHLSPEYSDLRYDRKWPWAVKPDQPLTRQDVFSLYRDWYAGTQFDMTKGLAAGFAGTPDRWDTPQKSEVNGAWERSIAMYRTGLVKVVQLQATTPERPREVAGVAWCAQGPALYSPFVPIPSGLSQQLSPLLDVNPRHPSKSALNWETRKVMMTAQIRFDHMHPLVEDRQKTVEAAGAGIVSSVQEELANGYRKWYKQGGLDHSLGEKFVQHTKSILDSWQQLSDDMLTHFSDNSDIPRIASTVHDVGADENTASLGYPAWWLRAVGFAKGQPPPVESQCPPLCPGPVELLGEDESSRSFVIGVFFATVVPGLTLLAIGFARIRCSSVDAAKDTAYSQL